MRQELRPFAVHSYGFRKFTSASQLNGLVRQLQFFADAWNLLLAIAMQDVQTAFDSMPHGLIRESLLARGVSPQVAGLHVRELTGMHAYIRLPHAGQTVLFPYTKGGKQGGIETPDEWKAVVDSIMLPIVEDWNTLNFGFSLTDEDGEQRLLVNHAVWADNIVLFASSFQELEIMVSDLNSAFSSVCNSSGSQYFVWKASSLELMVGGALANGPVPDLALEQDGCICKYVLRERVVLLGELLDSIGSTAASVHFNISRAEANYFKNQELLGNSCLPVFKRLRAWYATSSMIAAYNCETWHLTASIPMELRTWELKMLRRMLKMRRRPEEGCQQYNTRTAEFIRKLLSKAGVLPLHFRVLRAVFKEAWKNHNFVLDSGDSPLKIARGFRNTQWWQTHCFLNSNTQRRKHRRVGMPHALWENPFVVVWGIDWFSQLANCCSLVDWMRKLDSFLNKLCHLWCLTPLQPKDIEVPTEVWREFQLPATILDFPPLPPNWKETQWDAHFKRLWIQVDNQQLEYIFSGHSKLEKDDLRPICVRVARKMIRLLDSGWRPRTDIVPFIEWDPRRFNCLADHSANVALDLGRDWDEIDHEACRSMRDNKHCHLRLCSDGARRGCGSAAAGLALLSYELDGRTTVLRRSGKLLQNLNSAFVAEAIALEWCLDVFLEFVV